MKTQSYLVNYGNESIALHINKDFSDEINAQLEPFFLISPEQNESSPLIDVRFLKEEFTDIPVGEGESIDVDTSLYVHLASSGKLWKLKDRWVVNIHLTGSWFVFDSNKKEVLFYQPNDEFALTDIVRLIKGLITVAVELKGALQLHSSAVNTDSGSILLLGDMWQGKTTLLLELISNFNVSQLSCDTVVLSDTEEDGIAIHGWPSPFSMSHGTMSDHEKLHPFIPEERLKLSYDDLWKEGKKSVLTSQAVTELFGTSIVPRSEKLTTCIIARFNPKEPIGLRNISDVKELEDALRLVYLGSRDPIYHNWHCYFNCTDDIIENNIKAKAKKLLSTVQVIEMNWAPSAESLFKRITPLSQAHKTSGSLFDI
jgi:hypothetical protein